ncbi:Uncharacterised protein [Chromobacterium violaceum]|uniref:Uncharacterized protein n=1 Tax=Chromobacterium violaceum TaxID=536 RepID=A0A447THJ3_CHRVL|nr:Uncharacterised protein [Chromobacterium violaceum]
MEQDRLSRFLQAYLGRQPRRFGIDPREALSRLSEVMQWGDEKKDGRDEPAASGGSRNGSGPAAGAAGRSAQIRQVGRFVADSVGFAVQATV